MAEPIDVRDGPDAVLAVVLDLVGKLRGDGLAVDLHGAGVGVPGPVSFRDGVPVAPPIMPGWNQYPVRSVLSQHLGCPVQVDNDVNIMALGEMHGGLARTVDDLLFVKIGTGVGCGIIVNGQVYRGASGSAGDIGHIRVDDGGRSAPAATSAASRRTSAVPRWLGTPLRQRVRAGPTCSPNGSPRPVG